MLKIKLKKGDGFFDMPTLKAGQSGSMSEGVEGGTVILFTCKKDDSGSVISRSFSDKNVTFGRLRAIHDENIKKLAEIEVGESFEVEIVKKTGVLVMHFEHVLHEKTLH